MLRTAIAISGLLLLGHGAGAATLSQTIHFPGASADALYELYATSDGHKAVTGLPASYRAPDGAESERAQAGGTLDAFCFQPDMCALKARVLDISNAEGVHSITMAWWNFGWVSAVDPADMTVEGRGAPDSTLVLTFRDTLRGAQIELVQVNVPDFKVRIPNPDQTEEVGPLSSIVNTHWNTLYWDGFRRNLAP
ncbi:hypothetical protein [Nitratireductor sp. XY-223]|uniref:hypothetical protein n=1 Tax=Nitratireductor sp. XY-223 TaxID=2561926 RepID=UPI0010AA73C4|nr:hypothetical protein [Nitratireductor sp. XY-223]